MFTRRTLLGAVAALSWGVVATLRAALANHYGLCSGMPVAGQPGEALTPMRIAAATLIVSGLVMMKLSAS